MNYGIPFFYPYGTFSECIQYLQLSSLAKHLVVVISFVSYVSLIFCWVEKRKFGESKYMAYLMS